jgi:hypothetical protein
VLMHWLFCFDGASGGVPRSRWVYKSAEVFGGLAATVRWRA